MAYIPPHKRNSKDAERPSPTPESLSPQFKRNVKLGQPKYKRETGIKIIYADLAVSRWLVAGLGDNNQFPSYIDLQPVSIEAIERRSGEKPLALVNCDQTKAGGDLATRPWISISENILSDLLSSFNNVRSEMNSQVHEEVIPTLVARLGKVLFRGSSVASQGTSTSGLVSEATLQKLKRIFYTTVPRSYIDNVSNKVASRNGFDFIQEKDIYHVKLSDANRPDSTVSCKCRVMTEGKKLELYKIELNQLRHMVVDISCLNKNLDLRLMLCTKRTLTALTNDEMQSIRQLISSAVIDSEVKGGLRWPLEKASSANSYKVVGVWHTETEVYKSKSLKLKLRRADRFDFVTSSGEAAEEIILKFDRIASELLFLMKKMIDFNG